jgi:hypothetical protein
MIKPRSRPWRRSSHVLPRQRAPPRQVVGIHPVAVRNFVHRHARTQSLRNDSRLNLIGLALMRVTDLAAS